MIRSIAGSIARPLAVAITGASGGAAPAPVDAYAANGFSPAFVVDETVDSAPFYRSGGSTVGYSDIYTTDTTAGGLCTQNDSSGNLVWGPHNLLVYSEQFDNAAWTKGLSVGGVTANAITAPDGTATADLVFADTDADSNQQVVFQNLGATSKSRTFTVAAKSGGYDYVVVVLQTNGAQGYGASFDLTDGSVVSSRSGVTANPAVDLGDGWWLCSVKVEIAGNTFAVVQPSPDGVIDSPTGLYRSSYTGDGSSGVYLWGAHAYRSDLGGMADVPADQRAAAALTKYVPTTTAAKYLIRRRHYRYTGTSYVPTLLHEPVGATNLISYSNDDGQWVDSGVTSVEDDEAFLSTGQSATKLTANSGGGGHFAFHASTAVAASTTRCIAVRYKKDTHRYVNISAQGNAGELHAAAVFDVDGGGSSATETDVGTTSGTVLATYQVEVAANEYLLALVYTSTSNTIVPIMGFAGAATGNTFDQFGRVSWTAAGTEAGWFSGLQVEDNAAPSSYIPTTGASVTRSADTCKVKAAALPYDSTAMSFALGGRFNRIDDGNNAWLFTWGNSGTSRTALFLSYLTSNAGQSAVMAHSGGGEVISVASTPQAGVGFPVSMAGRVVAGTEIQVADSGAAATDTSWAGAMPALSGVDAWLGQYFSGGSTFAANGEFDTVRAWSDDIAEAGIEEASLPAPPLDTVSSAVLAFSVARKLRTAYSGNAIRVRRSSDNAEQDIGFSGGVLDESALLAFVGANNGFVTTIYEQSEHAAAVNYTQGTAAAQPQIVDSGSVITEPTTGLPAMRSPTTGANTEFVALTSWATRPSSAYVVELWQASGRTVSSVAGGTPIFAGLAQSGSVNTTIDNGAGNPDYFSDGAALTTGGAGTRGDLYAGWVDGSPHVVRYQNISFSNAAFASLRTDYGDAGINPPEYWSEQIIITDAGQVSALESNVASYYGITLA